MSTNLKQIVFENLDHAWDNGYFEEGEQLWEATAQEIADDMLAYCVDIDEDTTENILPHIEEWLKGKRQ